MYRNFSLDGRGKFFPPRGIRMELRDQRERGIEERKNFSLVTTLPYLFWDSPRARHATRYRFSKGRRKSTLFDHRSGRWPGFDDTKVYETTFQWRCFGFFLLSSFDRVIAKFENRWILVSRSHRFPTERSSPARSKAQSWGGFSSRTTIPGPVTWASFGPCARLLFVGRSVGRFSGRRYYSNFDAPRMGQRLSVLTINRKRGVKGKDGGDLEVER